MYKTVPSKNSQRTHADNTGAISYTINSIGDVRARIHSTDGTVTFESRGVHTITATKKDMDKYTSAMA